MIRKKIEEYCYSLGLTTVGMIPCRVFGELTDYYKERKEKSIENEFEESDIEKRINPFHYMEDAKTIISIAFPYEQEEERIENGFSTYTKRPDYHKVVMNYLTKICEYIEGLGGAAIGLVDSNTLPERYIAYLSGVGFIGRNNMIITKEYGSYVFLGEIITNLEIPCEDQRKFEQVKQHAECGECKRCYTECPTKSINAGRVNPNICLSYLTQKKELTDKELSLLKENIFGCDYCQLKCPYNEKAKKGALPEFQTIPYMNESAEVFASMDNKYFKENISKTSCGWRGKNVIRRNAIIHLSKQGKEIEQYKGDSPYINGYIERLN